MKKGIICIALGHPMYAHMAYNLAISLKYNAPEVSITIIKDSSFNQLFDWQQEVFDVKIDMDYDKIRTGERIDYLKAKTLIYGMTPYDKTIYLDVDMIWSPYKNVNDLFNLESLQFAVRDESTCEWAEKKSLFVTYGIDHWYNLSSEFIYFDKSPLNKKVFADAYRYYGDTRMPVVTQKEKKEGKKGITMFAGGKPDELPFGIAIEKNKVKMKCPYTPTYWQPHYFTKVHKDDYIQKEFYGISAGGNGLPTNIKRIYDNLAKYYYYKKGIKKTPYQLIAKRTILPERKLL